jgi:error-prone DNA polymerase
MSSLAHLHARSAFSFGDGASSVEALVLRAAEEGQSALALTDTNSVTGIPSLVRRCGQAGIKPIGGTEIILEGGERLTLLCDGPVGFSSLCQILSAAGLRDVKREGFRVRWEDLSANSCGLVCLSGSPNYGRIPSLLFRRHFDKARDYAEQCVQTFGKGNFAIEVTRSLAEGEWELSHRLFELADYLGVPAIATNGVSYAVKEGMAAHEALRRVRIGLAPDQQHGELPLNAERYLKSNVEMSRLFRDRPDATDNASLLAERLTIPLDPAVRHLPKFPLLPIGETAFSYLSALTWCGAERRYQERFGSAVQSRLVHELETIRDLGYADYFLVCWDVCNEARRRNIGFALRGSAVGSAVTYCLGMSPHDPIAENVSFERFLSKARAKPPDIDIDFRHDLRDEMMTYVRKVYGEERVANVANYVTYRGRSLLRDMGKVMGFDTSEIDQIRELLWHSRGDDLAEKLESQPELRALGIDPERYADLFALCAQLAGLPRHLGTHCSGLVVSDVPLCGVVPLLWAAKGVTVAAFDKDDIESPGIGTLKMDQLSLRALTAIDIATNRLSAEDERFVIDEKKDDADTYAMIRAAQTIGVFQLESPAQMALQWRLKADKFEDLIASVALIRPGPLVGGGVEPYVQTRHGWRKVTYPLPELEPVLKETYGRILYQDQVLDVVKVVGDFTPNEADAWLKAMTHARGEEEMKRLGVMLYERAKPKGLKGKAFQRLWKQIKGFSRYGFCHGHALAFASHAYRTAWLLQHYPAEFLAGVLSVEPCGFWPVATIIADAQRRGVVVYGPCVNSSDAGEWTVETIEDSKVIRCSLAFVQSMTAETGAAIVAERERNGAFRSLADAGRRLWFLNREQMEWLTLAGAFDGLDSNRRRTLWGLPVLHTGQRESGKRHPKPVNASQEVLKMAIPPLLPGNLADFSFWERFSREWQAVGFSTEGHPMLFHRGKMAERGVLSCEQLQKSKPGERVAVAGLVLRPHRPPTPSGRVVVFLTLEDETGLAQVTVVPDRYEACASYIFGRAAIIVRGIAEQRGAGVVLLAQATEPI